MQSYHLNVMFSGRLVTCYVFVSFHRSRGVGCYRNITHVLGERQQFLNFERFYGNRSMATGVDKASQCNASRNRLALERSPYLLQHASNPVDWYPWGEEAFEKAREQNKLIFLSVGYSTCHWCHVMERESFENQDIANVMNAHFINIKVDREERPDLDKVYMAFIQAITRGGGWPMSVWLTPQLTPVFGGTYFPPADNGGRAGFKTVLLNVQEQWENNRLLFLESGVKILDVLQDSASLEAPTLAEVPGPECAAALLLLYVRHYEPRHGGFGPAPKFPQVSNFEFLLNHYARDPDSEGAQRALDMCVHTLTCMARGGIHDHVSQGFARYSTDDRWHVPHFEKMLYDQGQLAVAYANAYAVTKNQLFAETLEDILTYVNRDLSHESGGFYSAEDADSLPTPSSTEKKEGAFCVWTHREVVDLLAPLSKKHAEAFAFHYNVKPEGNVAPRQDPHGELRHQNVLHVSDSDEATAEAVGLEVEALRDVLAECRRVLFEARQARPRPHLDSKMIAAWNGLMISGFARAAQVLRSAAHERRAVRAAEFVRDNLFDRTSGTLLRSCYRGEDGEIAQIAVPILGFLDDYAYMIRGLLDLFETCFDCEWLDWAEQLQDTQDKLFGDEEAGGYFNSPAADVTVVLRLKEGQDGAEPSGNSVSASNLLRLAAYLDRSDLSDRAARLLVAFSARLAQLPLAVPGMVAALTVYHDSVTHVFVTGERSDPDTAALLDVIHSRLVPGRVLALAPSRADAPVCVKCAAVLGMKPLAGKAAAYVCRHRACSLPVNTPEALAELLDRRN